MKMVCTPDITGRSKHGQPGELDRTGDNRLYPAAGGRLNDAVTSADTAQTGDTARTVETALPLLGLQITAGPIELRGIIDDLLGPLADLAVEGISTAMRQVIAAFAFDHLDAQHVTSAAFSDNVASVSVSRKVGYTENGVDIWAREGARRAQRAEGVETEGRAANARMPDTKIRPPATTNMRLTELRVMPPNEARKLRSTVLVSQPE